MKPHLPLLLLGSLLASLSASAVSTSYLAEGVDETDLAHSERFYDVGKGYYWKSQDCFSEVKTLYDAYHDFSFLGDLSPRINGTRISTEAFAGLTQDSQTCSNQTAANTIQYWLSFYAPFYTGSAPLDYGFTYSREHLEALGGTQSLDLAMLFYDSWKNVGNNMAVLGQWYFCGQWDAPTTIYSKPHELLKPGASAGGYFADYVSVSDIVYLLFKNNDVASNIRPTGIKTFTHELVKGFGMEEQADGSYELTRPGQLVYLSLLAQEKNVGHALTCYGYETDTEGMVTTVKVTNSDDCRYSLLTLYVAENQQGEVCLYTDSEKRNLWQYGNYTWRIGGLEYINTPESLLDLYHLYTAQDTPLTWTGLASGWASDYMPATADVLPGQETGWVVHIGDKSFNSYYDEMRPVRFDDSAANTTVRISSTKLRSSVAPQEMHLHNSVKDYLFIGDSADARLQPLSLVVEGTGSATFRDLLFATGDIFCETYRLNISDGARLAANTAYVGLHGVLELSGGRAEIQESLTFGKNATLRVSEISSISGAVTLQSGSVFDCVLHAEQKDTALLSIDGSLTLGSTVKLEIEGSGLQEGERYRICSVTEGSIDTTDFFTEHGTVSFSDLTLWLTYRAVPSYAWSGGSGSWSSSVFGHAAHNTVHADINFTGGSGTITLSGKVAPHHLSLHGGSYTFVGKGASIECEGYVNLDGNAELTLDVPLVSQGIMLEDDATLTLNTEKNSSLSFLSATEHTHLNFLGSVTYDLQDAGVLAGAISVGNGTTLDFRLAHDEYLEGAITSVSSTAAIRFENASSMRDIVIYEVGDNMQQFAGSVYVGREGAVRHTSLVLDYAPEVGQYTVAAGSKLQIQDSCAFASNVTGNGTLSFGSGAEFEVRVAEGAATFAPTLSLEVLGKAEVGTAQNRLSANLAHEVNVKGGHINIHLAGNSEQHYEKLSFDGGSYTYYTGEDAGSVTLSIERLEVAKNGGTIARVLETFGAYPSFAGITRINSVTGQGTLTLRGDDIIQMNYYAINGVGAEGFSGSIHVDNVGLIGHTQFYHMTALELGAGVYGSSVLLSDGEDNEYSRAVLGITADVTLRGLESEEWGASYLYSGKLRLIEADVDIPSVGDLIDAAAHTLTLDTTSDYHFYGAVSGPLHLVKCGRGTQAFRGDMSAFTGSVTVSGGSLVFAQEQLTAQSVLVEKNARLEAAHRLSVCEQLEMTGGELIARALTTTTASFTGQSVVQAGSISIEETGTLHVGLENLHTAVLELKNLSGALVLGELDIRYHTEDVAIASYKLLTMNRDLSTQLRDATILCNGTAVSIGEAGSSPLYLQNTGGGYDLMLDIMDGTAPLPRDEYATLHWQKPAGTWSLGTGETSGVWESEHENANFHTGDIVVFSAASSVTISGFVSPSSVLVENDSGTVQMMSATSASGISGMASLTKSGAGSLMLSSANSYRGGTTVQSGILTVGHASALGTGGVVLTGGTLNLGSCTVTNDVTATGGAFNGAKYAGHLTVNGDVSLDSPLKAATLTLKGGTLHGNISSADVRVLHAAGGGLDGSLTLNGGDLNLGSDTLEITGTLRLENITRLGLSSYRDMGTYTLISAASVSGSLNMLSYNAAPRRRFELSISGNDLLLTVTQQANNLTWTEAKGTWTAGSSIGGTVFEAGDTVNFRTAAALTIVGAVSPGEIVVNSAEKITFVSDKKTLGSGIVGDAAVTKYGSGMLTMNAGNTYTGGTALYAGTLKATAEDSFGTGAIIVKGGTLDLAGKPIGNAIILSGNATIKGDAKYTGDVTVDGNATLAAKTSFKGMTTIGSGSSLTLGDKVSMAGGIIVNGGSFRITAPKGMTLAKNAVMQVAAGGSVSGMLTVGAGSSLVWESGCFAEAPVLKGGMLNLGGEGMLTLTGSKAEVTFGEKSVSLPGKGTVLTDDLLAVCSGTVTLNALRDYEQIVDVKGGTLKLATGKVESNNTITVTGNAAVVNGAAHSGNILVTETGSLAKGSNIKLLTASQRVTLNGSGELLASISGAGIVDVNKSIDATAAKLTAARINLNDGLFTNTKGIKLAKGQTLSLNGASLNLGTKGALVTAAGSSLVVSGTTLMTGNLTLGGGELVLAGGALEVHGLLTLGKPMTVSGSGTITYDNLKLCKGELSAFFGGAEVTQTEQGLIIVGCALDSSSISLAAFDAAPTALSLHPATNPVADAMAQADWGIIDAERAFMGAVNSRHQHAALLDKGRGAVWVSAFGSAVRHGSKGVHCGADGNLSGAAFGLEHAVSETGSLGLAVGRSKNRIAATGVAHLRQETAHVALYGQKQLKHGFSADAAAAWGDTETKLGAAAWQQKSAALTARLTHARQLTDAAAFRTFGGLTYEATDAGSIGATHTGSVQNLRAELGAGATHTAGKAHFYAEAALTGDMVRHNPTADLDGIRTHGANPGRIGVRATVGGRYEFTDTWSGTASYGIETESRSTSHTFNIGVSKTF